MLRNASREYLIFPIGSVDTCQSVVQYTTPLHGVFKNLKLCETPMTLTLFSRSQKSDGILRWFTNVSGALWFLSPLFYHASMMSIILGYTR